MEQQEHVGKGCNSWGWLDISVGSRLRVSPCGLPACWSQETNRVQTRVPSLGEQPQMLYLLQPPAIQVQGEGTVNPLRAEISKSHCPRTCKAILENSISHVEELQVALQEDAESLCPQYFDSVSPEYFTQVSCNYSEKTRSLDHCTDRSLPPSRATISPLDLA